jgi:hypothetical protein
MSTVPPLVEVDAVAVHVLGDPDVHPTVEQLISVLPACHDVVRAAGMIGVTENVATPFKKEYTVMLGLQAVGRTTPKSLELLTDPGPPVTRL